MSWRREPLLHFLVFGALLFILHGVFRGDDANRTDSIVVTRGDVQQLLAIFQKQWQRSPTPAELQGLVQSHIREEVLYREALAMGLDQDDTILRRRLVQKLEFLTEDLASQAEPTDAELRAYLRDNAERFRIPARLQFRQVYLSPEAHGERVEAEAQQLLNTLRRSDIHAAELGDSSLLPHELADASQAEVARTFGEIFASALFALDGTGWQGPLQSSYGLHLVRVESRTESRLPDLFEIRDDVAREVGHERRVQFKDAFYRQLLTRYDVEIEPFDVEAEGTP